MTIDDIIPDASAILELRADDAAAALAELATALAQRSGLTPERVLAGLQEREALGATAIGQGLALPHTKAEVAHTIGVLGLARAGIEFSAPDGDAVRVFLALVSPTDPGEHLRALACVSRVFSDRAMIERLLACPDAAAILATLRGHAK